MPAKIRKAVFGLLPFVLIAVLLLSLLFFPQEAEKGDTLVAVRVWNVDTFEGGKGSRTSFLKRIAGLAEKKNKGVYYLITSYTAEGAEEAFRKGERPDVISFGIGFSLHAEFSLPLPYASAGGELGGRVLAVPWCRGEYRLFSLTGFGEEGETILSAGGSNLVEVAAQKNGLMGRSEESLAAYTDFLAGKCRYLLGTQRDVCRFSARGTEVESRELPVYNDLYQYISVLSADKRSACLILIDELLSEAAQATLSEIGMLPVAGDPSKFTPSVFTDSAALGELRRLALAGDEKNLDKFLKTV